MEKQRITEDSLIIEALKINKNAATIFMSHGMHCLGCAMAHGETVGQAAGVHGADMEKLLEQLNAVEK